MNSIWKAVALTSALWAVLLVVLVTMVAAPAQDWRHGGGRADHAGATVHMRGGMGARTEYDYLAEMVPHHEEAIAAAAELRRSDSAELRRLGEGIETSQRAQVRLMEGWLSDWYPDRPAYDRDYRPMMRDLDGLSGEALDRAFLTDMVHHHMMAVMSSQHLLRRGDVEHRQVAELAATIRDEQSAEILLMRRLVNEYDGARPGGPLHGAPARGPASCPRA